MDGPQFVLTILESVFYEEKDGCISPYMNHNNVKKEQLVSEVKLPYYFFSLEITVFAGPSMHTRTWLL